MSATLNNAGLELIKQELIKQEDTPLPAPTPRIPSPASSFGHEALQALLAFSALHEQIRASRVRQRRDGGPTSPQDDLQVEQFVLDEVLQLVADRALAITGADGMAIALAEGQAIVCRASAGSIAPDVGMRLDPNSGFSGECLVSGRVVRCDDADTDPRVDLLACNCLGVRSLLAVPLAAKETVIGLVEAFSSEPHGFNDSDVRSLSLLAELILSAMKPEEEDRLTEISRRVVHSAPLDRNPIPTHASPSEVAKPELEPLIEPPIEPSGENFDASPSGESSPASSAKNPQLLLPTTPEPPDRSLVLAKPAALDPSRPGLGVVAALVLFAAALGAGVWWTLGHHAPSIKATTRSVAPVLARQPDQPIASPSAVPAATAAAEPVTTETKTNEDAIDPSPATAQSTGLLPQITAIRHWSSDDSSTVVIEIQDQVQYEAHRLPNPERIYLDLHDTALAATFSSRNIAVNDALLQRVRVAQPVAGVTRVVLETNGASDFSVSLEPNPYRLVIEIRKLGTKPRAGAKLDLFAPMNSADQAAIKQSATSHASANSIPTIPQNSPAAISNQNQPLATSAKPLAAGEIPALLYTPKLRIVLDAGHGGWDLGTVGRKGLLEKDLVLDIVERLGNLVQSRLGADVIYTRKDDSYLALEKRAEIANLAQANLFISVHANYSDYPSARGVETYYTNTYSSVKARTDDADDSASGALKTINWTNVDIREKVRDSRRIAASVQHALYAMLAANNPGLRNRGVKEAHYVVLTGTSMPAILAEVSFVSSPSDENNLQSSAYRQQIAEALYSGIAHYQASNRNIKMASASAKPTGR